MPTPEQNQEITNLSTIVETFIPAKEAPRIREAFDAAIQELTSTECTGDEFRTRLSLITLSLRVVATGSFCPLIIDSPIELPRVKEIFYDYDGFLTQVGTL